MQLRVARLCLDCEELHVEDSCPICASDRYAFVSTWLPSEERRRWRRPAAPVARDADGPVASVRRLVARWFDLEEPRDPSPGPRTRASDRMPRFDVDDRAPAAPATEPAKGDLR